MSSFSIVYILTNIISVVGNIEGINNTEMGIKNHERIQVENEEMKYTLSRY